MTGKGFRRGLLMCLVLVLAGIGMFYWSSRRSPLIEGKSLDQWLEQVTSSQPLERTKAEGIILQHGKTALPWMIRTVQARPIVPGKTYEAIQAKLPKVMMRLVPNPNETRQRQLGALQALAALGTNATPAIPTLSSCLKGDDFPILSGACRALGRMGPAGIQALSEMLTNRNQPFRFEAVQGLSAAGQESILALPAMREALCTGDQQTAPAILQLLKRLGKPGAEAIAMGLVDATPTRSFKKEMLGTLLKMGSDATNAIPQIERLTTNDDPELAAAAADVLKEIRR